MLTTAAAVCLSRRRHVACRLQLRLLVVATWFVSQSWPWPLPFIVGCHARNAHRHRHVVSVSLTFAPHRRCRRCCARSSTAALLHSLSRHGHGGICPGAEQVARAPCSASARCYLLYSRCWLCVRVCVFVCTAGVCLCGCAGVLATWRRVAKWCCRGAVSTVSSVKCAGVHACVVADRCDGSQRTGSLSATAADTSAAANAAFRVAATAAVALLIPTASL